MLMYLLPNDKLIYYQNQWYDNTLSSFVHQNQIDNLNTSYKLIYSISQNTAINQTITLNIDLLSKSQIIINIDGSTSSTYNSYGINIGDAGFINFSSHYDAYDTHYFQYLICGGILCETYSITSSNGHQNCGQRIGAITANTLTIDTSIYNPITYTIKIWIA